MPTSKFFCGTSGLVLPVPNKQAFPEAYRTATRLTYYASLFNSLEVNSSFYKVPRPATFARWTTEVPPGFRFTIKLWRGITHEPGLAFSPADITQFMRSAAAIGPKQGCLLIQLPPGAKADKSTRLQQLLENITAAEKIAAKIPAAAAAAPPNTPAPEPNPPEQPLDSPAPEKNPPEQPLDTPAPEKNPPEQPLDSPAPEKNPPRQPPIPPPAQHASEQPTPWRLALEFRDPSWYTEATDALLERFNATRVLQDIPRSFNWRPMLRTSTIYMRYHGPAGDYRGGYTEKRLKQDAEKIRGWLSEGKDVYVYFNNTIGDAIPNAQFLNDQVNPPAP